MTKHKIGVRGALAWLGLALVLLLSLPSYAQAYSFTCDKQQVWCFVKTKRMVPGDWVGIFDRSSRLIAIGKIDAIVGEKRRIRIVKRYAPIADDNGLARIRDEVLDNPGAYYTIYQGPAQFVVGGQVGIASVGLGKGLAGFSGEAHADYKLTRYAFLTGRLFYTYSRGEAAIEQGEFIAREIEVNFFGGLAGIAGIAEPVANLYLRGELSVGMAGVFGNTADDVPLEDAVEGRVIEGFGFASKVGISAIYQRKGSFQPFIEAGFLRVQEANIGQLSLGIRMNVM